MFSALLDSQEAICTLYGPNLKDARKKERENKKQQQRMKKKETVKANIHTQTMIKEKKWRNNIYIKR